jgi:hypothetical protein
MQDLAQGSAVSSRRPELARAREERTSHRRPVPGEARRAVGRIDQLDGVS